VRIGYELNSELVFRRTWINRIAEHDAVFFIIREGESCKKLRQNSALALYRLRPPLVTPCGLTTSGL